jgi:hypothetical protein
MQVVHTSTQVAWKQVYQDALFELDPIGFLVKLEAAQKAIDERLHEVFCGGATDRRELIELEDAKHAIQCLRRHEQQI